MSPGVRAIVAEGDVALRDTIVEVLKRWDDAPRAVGSLAELRLAFQEERFNLLLLDFRLQDGISTDFLRDFPQDIPFPVVVSISGEAEPAQAFHLAQLGVRSYLKKPFGLSDVEAAVERALISGSDVAPQLRATVGHRPLAELEGQVRRAMVTEALAQKGGSIRGAAGLLGISRQLLHHILKK